MSELSRSAASRESTPPAPRALGQLTACSNIDNAAWIPIALHGFDGQVGSIVPPVLRLVFHDLVVSEVALEGSDE